MRRTGRVDLVGSNGPVSALGEVVLALFVGGEGFLFGWPFVADQRFCLVASARLVLAVDFVKRWAVWA